MWCILVVPRCIEPSKKIIGGLVWRETSQNLCPNVLRVNSWRPNIRNLLESFSLSLYWNGSGNTSPWTSLSIFSVLRSTTMPFGWLWINLPNRHIFWQSTIPFLWRDWPRLQKALSTNLHFNTTFHPQIDGQFEGPSKHWKTCCEHVYWSLKRVGCCIYLWLSLLTKIVIMLVLTWLSIWLFMEESVRLLSVGMR